MRQFIQFSLTVLLLLPILAIAAMLPDKSSVGIKETVLMTLPSNMADEPYDIVVSDDFSRCAAVMMRPDMRCYLYDNGKKSPAYDTMAADFAGKHLCYDAFSDEKRYFAMDGKVIPECESVYANPDGSRLAYLFRPNGKYCVEIDGKKGPVFDYLAVIGWSLDGRHLRYLGDRGGTETFLQDDKACAAFPTHGPHAFPKISPDGRRIAYVERIADDQYMLNVDGRRFGPYGYEKIQNLYFSPDSKRYVAVIAHGEGKETTYQYIIDGVISQEYRNFRNGFVTTDPNHTDYFSPDSRHVAYSAEIKPDTWALFVDGVTWETTYYRLENPIFSPDSRHIGCTAEVKKGNETYWCVLLDGKEQRRFPHDISGLTFSPDFQRWQVTHIRKRQDGSEEWSIIASDGTEYRNINCSSACYTRDSRHFTYLVEKGTDDKSEQYRVTAYIDGVKVSGEYRRALSAFRATGQGVSQIVFQKMVTPEHGKPYQAIVRVDISIGQPGR